MTLAGWQTLLLRLRERLDSLGVTLHEIEESPTGSASPSGEAPYWLERAETIVIQRQAELDELTGWMTRRDTTAAARSLRWCRA